MAIEYMYNGSGGIFRIRSFSLSPNQDSQASPSASLMDIFSLLERKEVPSKSLTSCNSFSLGFFYIPPYEVVRFARDIFVPHP